MLHISSLSHRLTMAIFPSPHSSTTISVLSGVVSPGVLSASCPSCPQGVVQVETDCRSCGRRDVREEMIPRTQVHHHASTAADRQVGSGGGSGGGGGSSDEIEGGGGGGGKSSGGGATLKW